LVAEEEEVDAVDSVSRDWALGAGREETKAEVARAERKLRRKWRVVSA
jgi:hypothetical protein